MHSLIKCMRYSGFWHLCVFSISSSRALYYLKKYLVVFWFQVDSQALPHFQFGKKKSSRVPIWIKPQTDFLSLVVGVVKSISDQLGEEDNPCVEKQITCFNYTRTGTRMYTLSLFSHSVKHAHLHTVTLTYMLYTHIQMYTSVLLLSIRIIDRCLLWI